MSDPSRPLRGIIRRLSSPLEPQPTGVEPRLEKLPGIRAVVFDVYGTLLISGSGDISLTSGVSQGSSAEEAFQQVFGEPGASATGVNGETLVKALRAGISGTHAVSQAEYPEVRIRLIWREVFNEFGIHFEESQLDQFATEYECRVNPVWPMPGMAETLHAIRDAGLAMGIVSNAQFFTPLAIEELAGESMRLLGFDPPLSVWSYSHLQAKPGVFLYERSAEALATRGVRPHETLYLGNDILNDVWPASRVGFRTALFAGEARSLRLREEDDRVAGLEPDVVVTELPQILDCLG